MQLEREEPWVDIAMVMDISMVMGTDMVMAITQIQKSQKVCLPAFGQFSRDLNHVLAMD